MKTKQARYRFGKNGLSPIHGFTRQKLLEICCHETKERWVVFKGCSVLNFKVTFAKTYNEARKLDNNGDTLLQRHMIRHELKNCLQRVMIKVKQK